LKLFIFYCQCLLYFF